MEEKKKNLSNKILTYIQIILVVAIIFVVGRNFLIKRSGSSSQASLSQLGMAYYNENYGKELGTAGVESVVKNFGCHSEIHIFKDGQLLMRLNYFNGKVYEIEQ